MRIYIEVDDKCTCKISIDKKSEEDGSQAETGDVMGQINAVPPAELLKIAAEIGAESAGAAPLEFMPAATDQVAKIPKAFAEMPAEASGEVNDENAGPPSIDDTQ